MTDDDSLFQASLPLLQKKVRFRPSEELKILSPVSAAKDYEGIIGLCIERLWDLSKSIARRRKVVGVFKLSVGKGK